MGIAVILCALVGLFSRSAEGRQDSHPGAAGGAGPGLGVVLGWATLALALIGPVVLVILWRRDFVRPGSLGRRAAKRGARDVSAWPAWMWALCGVVTFIAAGVGAGMAQSAALGMGAAPELVVRAAQSVAGVVLGSAAGVVLAVMLRERGQRAGLELRPTWGSVRAGAMALAATLPVVQGASVLSVLLYAALMGAEPAPIAHDTLRSLHEQPGSAAVWVIVASAVIGAPIMEELVFRVFLQSAVLRLTGRAWFSIVVTSLIFAMLHIDEQSVASAHWHALIPLFVLSVALGVAYEWTKRPMVPVIVHMGFNGFNVALVALGAV